MAGHVKDLLRLATVGSVDDGKSTLIGRLLFETKKVFEDQLVAVEAASKRLNRDFDLALLTDGLRAEREQGITIDVAYRYFQTERRRFIIADTPGHEQYTRNMVTGASTADLILLLIDARAGIQVQSKRHAFISSLLGIPHVVVAVNKMDLVDFSEERFEEIRTEYGAFCSRMQLESLHFVPISALEGDNIVNRSDRMDWYDGPSVLEHLESVYVGGGTNLVDLRLPVQLVVRPNAEFRGYAGQIVSGVIRKGEEIMVHPGNQTSRVASLVNFDGEVDTAFAPQSVTVVLGDEIDISRGDMLVHPGNRPRALREGEAILVWMGEEEFRTGRPYIVKLGTNSVRAVFPELTFRIDPNTLHREKTDTLGLNEIGRVSMRTFKPLVCDNYERNRRTGGFIVIDPATNGTVAAGMIIERGRDDRHTRAATADPISQNISRTSGRVDREARERILGQRAGTIWLTGLSGSGKSTIAFALEQELTAQGHLAYVLDGDNVRHGLNRDLGFAPEDRQENIRRIAEVAALFNQTGVIVISSFISPYAKDRDSAREIVGGSFLEVFVDAPLEVCEARDPKGLYKRARAGEIAEFTGLTAPYEPPKNPDMHLRTDQASPEEIVQAIIAELKKQGRLH